MKKLKNIVGETISWDDHPYKVIGLIKDMIMESPYQEVRPQFFHIDTNPDSNAMLKINPASGASASMDKTRKIFSAYSPAEPFNFKFVDIEYAKKFGNEERIGKLAGFFAALAIFISCLGLFGMASFMAEQRIKEIGIRKVLGATVMNLWGFAFKRFPFAGDGITGTCCSAFCLFHGKLAAKLQLSLRTILVDLWCCLYWRFIHYPADSKLSGY